MRLFSSAACNATRAADLRDLDVVFRIKAAFGRKPARRGFLGAADSGDADHRSLQCGNALLQRIARFDAGFLQETTARPPAPG